MCCFPLSWTVTGRLLVCVCVAHTRKPGLFLPDTFNPSQQIFHLSRVREQVSGLGLGAEAKPSIAETLPGLGGMSCGLC